MTSTDELLSVVRDVDPLWALALIVLAAIVLLAAKLGWASFGRLAAVAAVLAVVTAAGAAGYVGYHHLQAMRILEERRALDVRAAQLFSQTVQPGTVFACVDGSLAPAMLEGCERSLFAEPHTAAAAVAVVTMRLAFLADALQFANERDAAYLGRIESLRNSIEADPYGLVGYVLSINHNCTAESCDRLDMFRNAERVKENIRVRRFEAIMAKHAPGWRGASATEADSESPLPTAEAAGPVPGVTIGERAGAAAEVTDPTASREPALESALPSAPSAAFAPVIRPPATEPASDDPAPTTFANPPQPAPRPQPTTSSPPAEKNSSARAAARSKSGPGSPRVTEPVGGLPRVVPGDYVREQEEEPQAQASGQPGAPVPLAPPQQNFIGR